MTSTDPDVLIAYRAARVCRGRYGMRRDLGVEFEDLVYGAWRVLRSIRSRGVVPRNPSRDRDRWLMFRAVRAAQNVSYQAGIKSGEHPVRQLPGRTDGAAYRRWRADRPRRGHEDPPPLLAVWCRTHYTRRWIAWTPRVMAALVYLEDWSVEDVASLWGVSPRAARCKMSMMFLHARRCLPGSRRFDWPAARPGGSPVREKLPDRRRSWTQKAKIPDADGRLQTFYLTCGEYPDGRLGEIWVEAHKEGTFARGVLGAMARTASVALQTGTSVGEVVKIIRDLDFPPRGRVVAGMTDVAECKSVADWVAQEIENAYVLGKSPRPESTHADPRPRDATTGG